MSIHFRICAICPIKNFPKWIRDRNKRISRFSLANILSNPVLAEWKKDRMKFTWDHIQNLGINFHKVVFSQA